MARQRPRGLVAAGWLVCVALAFAACDTSVRSTQPVVATAAPATASTPAPTATVPGGNSASTELAAAIATLGPAGDAIDPGTKFQQVADAITAASAAGLSPDEIRETVTVAMLGILQLPGGLDAVDRSDQAVNGKAATVTVGSRTASLAAGVHQAAAGPEAAFYFVNGVLNTEADALTSAGLIADRLSKHLKRTVSVTAVYNRSATGPRNTMLAGCAAASQLPPTHAAADLVNSVCRQAESCSNAALLKHELWSSIDSFNQLVLQRYLDSSPASDPVNVTLERLVRADVAAGKRVIVIGHSQGTLFVRDVLARLADLSTGSVGGVFLAPAFGTGDNLNTALTRYVLLKGDPITGLSTLNTIDPVSSQPQSSPLDLHVITTYLQEGTPSLQRFLDGVTDVMKAMGVTGAALPSDGRPMAMQEASWNRPATAGGAPAAAAGCGQAPTYTRNGPPQLEVQSDARSPRPKVEPGSATWQLGSYFDEVPDGTYRVTWSALPERIEAGQTYSVNFAATSDFPSGSGSRDPDDLPRLSGFLGVFDPLDLTPPGLNPVVAVPRSGGVTEAIPSVTVSVRLKEPTEVSGYPDDIDVEVRVIASCGVQLGSGCPDIWTIGLHYRYSRSPASTTGPASTAVVTGSDGDLLGRISSEIRAAADCQPIAPTDGFTTARSTIICRFPTGGVAGVTFRLYDTTQDAAAAYAGWQNALRDSGGACENGSFEGSVSVDGRNGRLLCYVADGSAYLWWTDTTQPVVGVAWRTDSNLPELYRWWAERDPLAP